MRFAENRFISWLLGISCAFPLPRESGGAAIIDGELPSSGPLPETRKHEWRSGLVFAPRVSLTPPQLPAPVSARPRVHSGSTTSWPRLPKKFSHPRPTGKAGPGDPSSSAEPRVQTSLLEHLQDSSRLGKEKGEPGRWRRKCGPRRLEGENLEGGTLRSPTSPRTNFTSEIQRIDHSSRVLGTR